MGLARTGSVSGNGSGDIFLAFSTANVGADNGNSATGSEKPVSSLERIPASRLDPLFLATVQATEEAVDDAMIAAETMTGADYTRSYGIPHKELQDVLRKHSVLRE